jgi:hypothetical protein
VARRVAGGQDSSPLGERGSTVRWPGGGRRGMASETIQGNADQFREVWLRIETG